MIGLLLAMYPAPWRRRYGEEFRAVLESRPLGPFDVADILIGALDARLVARRLAGTTTVQGDPIVMLRLGGFGAIAGGVLWFFGLATWSLLSSDPLWSGMLVLGTLALLVALIGLSSFQAHRHATLAWAAFVIPGLGALVSIIGLVGMILQGDSFLLGPLDAWSVWATGLLTMLVGSILFGVATVRAAVLPRRAAQALAVSAVVVLLMAFGGLGMDLQTIGGQVLMVIVVGSFAASWVALGVAALRSGPIRAIAPAGP